MSAYLDASVLLPTLLPEAAQPAVFHFLATTPETLIVSDFAAAEVSSGLSRLVRMGALTLEDATGRLADFDVWRASTTQGADIAVADARLADIYVRRFELMLRAPDALHLAMSRRLDATLVTLDRRLVAAARELGVSVVEPE